MRYLIVDDDSSKANSVSDFIKQLDVDATTTLVKNAVLARKALISNYFDVLLLDLVLPNREGSLPSASTSLELLMQIYEDTEIPSPRYVVGITAHLEAKSELTKEFGRRNAQILEIAAGANSWKDSLRSLFSAWRQAAPGKRLPTVDVCIINALRDPEHTAIREHWPIQVSSENYTGRGFVYVEGKLVAGERELNVIAGYLNQMGPVSSTLGTALAISQFRPRVAIMTGICGGMIGKAKLGDVVVADRSWDWQAGKWTNKFDLEPEPYQIRSSRDLVQDAESARGNLKNYHEAYSGVKPGNVPELRTGPMITGSAVVASSNLQDLFKDQHRKTVAVDMECYGFYFGCAEHVESNTDFLCIKAVADLANRRKNDELQAYGSYLSAMVGLHMVNKRFGV
jgi:nucleoside phosphorylase